MFKVMGKGGKDTEARELGNDVEKEKACMHMDIRCVKSVHTIATTLLFVPGWIGSCISET